MKKRSLFERLSGAIPASDEYDAFDDEYTQPQKPQRRPMMQQAPQAQPQPIAPVYEEEQSAEGQLPVDVYQTANEIIIRTFVAGVRPDELNVSISRDMVVIEGSRDAHQTIDNSDYFHQELFWGSFSRTILLPEEVDVDNSSAGSKDGLLTLILPKLDKARQTKLRVKAG
ncbi:MAG TPA: Hsp20/alpha crystallin family protein [Candidatus Paceibacterota bacterium]|nr:Hsp20/alpha crystallin family protein [Candidatus Paceibacterota bacterium]